MNLRNLTDIEDIVSLQIKEDVHLEFKRSDIITRGKTNELTKEVCAFANSDGGVLVIGLVDGKGGVAEAIDSGVRTTERGRERIEQGLLLIRPLIQGIEIVEIPKETGIIYVLMVPKSRSAPHQAQDKCYYKRYGSISSPMENFELEDVRARSFNDREPLEISINLHGMLFHISLRNTSPFELNDLSLNLESNFDALLRERGRDISHIRLLAMKPRTTAEYLIGSGYEIFQTENPHLSVKYFYSCLGAMASGVEELHIADYANQSIIRTDAEKSLERIAISIEKIEKQNRDFIAILRDFRPMVNGTGLKLSRSALRALGGDISEKLEPFGMDADGFAEVLGVDVSVGRKLERMFGYIGAQQSFERELTKLPADIQDRFRKFFSTREEDRAAPQ